MTDPNSIQPGDLVECIDNTCAADFLALHTQYHVFAVRDNYVYLDEDAVIRHRGWNPSRFRKITQPSNQSKEHTVPNNNDQIFTAQEVIDAVMDYSSGCREGKIAFLRDQFDLSPEPEPEVKEFNVTVTLSIPVYDNDSVTNSRTDVKHAVVTALQNELARDAILDELDSTSDFALENWSVS